MLTALFRCDGSDVIGLGHVSRCLTLANALSAKGVASSFAMSGASTASEWVRARHASVAIVEGAIGSDDDLRSTNARIAHDSAAIVIIDGYDFSSTYVARISSRATQCVIDDLAADSYDCDFILNQAPYATPRHYASSTARLLLGPSYALLREEFAIARGKRAATRENATRLLLTFGGADPTDVMKRVLPVLAAADAGFEIRAIVGAQYPNPEALRAMSRPGVSIIFDAKDMAAHMAWADVAVTAGGGTCLEIACVGVPMIAVVVADNQRPGVEALARHGALVAFDAAELDPRALLRAIANLAADFGTRRRMIDVQRELVDGLGAARVASALLEHTTKRGGTS